MDDWLSLLLPFSLLLARVSAFVMVLPIFSWRDVPMRVRAALALLLTIFVAIVLPRPAVGNVSTLAAAVLLGQELLWGLGLGLGASFIFLAVQQGARIVSLQMGLGEAEIYDPVSGEPVEAIDTFLEMTFVVFFLALGGHHLLLMLIFRSFDAFPVASAPDVGVLSRGLVEAGSAMLVLALKASSPVLAAFLVLSVLLAVLARVLPEMNILFTSLPLRVGLGLFMAAAILPLMNGIAGELAQWIDRLLVT